MDFAPPMMRAVTGCSAVGMVRYELPNGREPFGDPRAGIEKIRGVIEKPIIHRDAGAPEADHAVHGTIKGGLGSIVAEKTKPIFGWNTETE